MQVSSVNSERTARPLSGYSHAVEVSGAARLLFIGGQIPVDINGNVPESFEDQARLAWQNVIAQLEAAGMGLENVVKHTTFLSDRRYTMHNQKVRSEVFGDLNPALTLIITGIFDESWLLEIEAVAAA